MTIEVTEIKEIVNISVDQLTEIINIEVLQTNDVVNIEVAEVGAKGDNGKSAYQIAAENGFVGTLQEWLTTQKNIKFEDLQELP